MRPTISLGSEIARRAPLPARIQSQGGAADRRATGAGALERPSVRYRSALCNLPTVEE
jgi:hypothetical protein